MSRVFLKFPSVACLTCSPCPAPIISAMEMPRTLRYCHGTMATVPALGPAVHKGRYGKYDTVSRRYRCSFRVLEGLLLRLKGRQVCYPGFTQKVMTTFMTTSRQRKAHVASMLNCSPTRAFYFESTSTDWAGRLSNGEGMHTKGNCAKADQEGGGQTLFGGRNPGAHAAG